MILWIGHYLHRKVLKTTGFSEINFKLDYEHNFFNLSTSMLEWGVTGDLLSLYLFVFCIEIFHHKNFRAVRERRWTPLRLARGGSLFSHLFFVVIWSSFLLISESYEIYLEYILLRVGQLMNRNTIENLVLPKYIELTERYNFLEFWG